MIANVLKWFSSFFQNLFNAMLKGIGAFFQSVINVIKWIMQPIFIVIGIVFYFLYKIGEIIVALVMVIVGIGKLLYSLVMGLFNTIASLAWTSSAPPDHGSWSYSINQIFAGLEYYQLDKLAYVLSFGIWVTTAFLAIKILSSRSSAD